MGRESKRILVMRKKLILNEPEDRITYKNLVSGFLSGGDPKSDKSKEKIYQLSRIKKALFSCGDIVDIPLQPELDDKVTIAIINDPGVLVYRPGKAICLRNGKSIVDLLVRDWDLLEKHMVNTPWLTIASDEIAEVFDRISTLEQVREGEKEA